MNGTERARRNEFWFWTLMLFLGGIDGFKLLEPLRELGARPFFLVFLVATAILLQRKKLLIDFKALLGFGTICFVSLLGFLFFGASLTPFGDKAPFTQFVAHAILFLLGFSPIFLKFRSKLSERTLIKAAVTAMALHGVFLAIDELAILTDSTRPFESSFLGSIGRTFPTGLFSEPSYVAAYLGVLLPVSFYRARLMAIILCSTIACALFYIGDVRSFFVIFAAGMFALILVRWGLSWKALLAAAFLGLLVAVAATALNLLTVEESLSSAYRFGNTLSYLDHAISHNLLIGDGFGSSHFLYPRLNFPAFIYLSPEFNDMLGGSGNRVPVFNLWVRLFIEVGVIATFILLAWFTRRFLAARLSDVATIFVVASFVCSMSADSYIYGMFTVALMLLFSVQLGNDNMPELSGKKRRRKFPWSLLVTTNVPTFERIKTTC